jgi:hypothetical protein
MNMVDAPVVSGQIDGDLRTRLYAMRQSGADRYAPAQFRFIEALARRSLGHQPAVAGIIEARALTALRDYQASLTQAQEQAAVLLDAFSAEFPALAAQLQALFAAGQFRQMQRLAADHRRGKLAPGAGELNLRLAQAESSPGNTAQDACLDDLLVRQERAALASIDAQAVDAAAVDVEPPRELKSARGLRKARARQSAASLVNQAAVDCPQNSGPLNPHMLATRTLAMIREISPGYLQHMVAYIDTLFWLESVEQRSRDTAGKAGGNKRRSKVVGSQTKT